MSLIVENKMELSGLEMLYVDAIANSLRQMAQAGKFRMAPNCVEVLESDYFVPQPVLWVSFDSINLELIRGNNYRTAHNNLLKLSHRSLEDYADGSWQGINLISYPALYHGTGTFVVGIHWKLIPEYMKILSTNIIHLRIKSRYHRKLYELLESLEPGKWKDYEVVTLLESLELSQSYDYRLMNRDVLKPALKEFKKKKAPLTFEYEALKDGRKVRWVRLRKLPTTPSSNSYSKKDIIDIMLSRNYTILLQKLGVSEAFINTLLSRVPAYLLAPFMNLAARKLKNNEFKENPSGWVFTVAQAEFGAYLKPSKTQAA